MSTKPKKAPTKAKEPKLPKNWGKVDEKVFRNEALDAAIERGERLEKIAEIIEKRNADARYYGSDYWPDDYPLLVKILKLAKGA